MVMGTRLDDAAAGMVVELQKRPRLRSSLGVPGTVVIDESEKEKLGIRNAGDIAAVNGHRVRVIGFVENMRALGGPFVLCSLETAQVLLNIPAGEGDLLLRRCNDPAPGKGQGGRARRRAQDGARLTRGRAAV